MAVSTVDKAESARSASGEVEHRLRAFIQIKDKQASAKQLFTRLDIAAGTAIDVAVIVESIGLARLGELTQTEIEFSTLEGGANGGSVALAQATPLGICKASYTTKPGQSSKQIADGLFAVLSIPSFRDTDGCRFQQNMFDVEVADDRLVLSSATGLALELRDVGIGVSIRPRDPTK